VPPIGPSNLVLEYLPPQERDRLLEAGRHLEAASRQLILAAGEPATSLYFPLSGMASIVAPDRSGTAVEVVAVGREGIVGATALYELEALPFEAMWQVPSTALAVDLADIRQLLPSCPQLQSVTARYMGSLLVQSGQNVACNRVHRMDQRAAKWLLLMHDRMNGDTLLLAQELLATMLGVTRPKLSQVESDLRADGLIGPREHGVFGILDRPGLELRSCDCYAVIRDELASWHRYLAERHGSGPTDPGRGGPASEPSGSGPSASGPTARTATGEEKRSLFVVRVLPAQPASRPRARGSSAAS
jgi:CRP-like cAMP-binding protein